MPILDKMVDINNDVLNFKLLEGYSAETSGGILCMVEKNMAKDFIKESLEVYGQESWIVGEVIKGEKKAYIRPDREIINIKESFLHN